KRVRFCFANYQLLITNGCFSCIPNGFQLEPDCHWASGNRRSETRGRFPCGLGTLVAYFDVSVQSFQIAVSRSQRVIKQRGPLLIGTHRLLQSKKFRLQLAYVLLSHSNHFFGGLALAPLKDTLCRKIKFLKRVAVNENTCPKYCNIHEWFQAFRS